MSRKVIVLFDEEVRTFSVDEAVLEDLSIEKARAWLLDVFDVLGCVPTNPMGKLLAVDLILGIARAAGVARFDAEPEWASRFASAALRLREASVLEVDVVAYELRGQ